MASQSEAELIARCRQGDAAAWDAVFDRHYAAVGRFVLQTGPELSPEDAEEIAQETFLAAIKNLASFRGQAQLQTWLFRIALNKARDFRERGRAAKRGGGRAAVSLQAEDPETGLPLDPPSDLPAPDEQAVLGEQERLVMQAVDRLNEPCREVIQLRYFADLGYEEIGRELKLNEKTVSSRLSKCLDKLESIVQELFLRERTAVSPSN
ncbi:MAG: sigma-70 family RNA polymerase sigma factor [Verrucomicrobia bacterium]|nr:sigma-70 family RNA polymerase sigma factor [Verrucomicrobiota bacterium]